ncbi:MAG: hypothetical protein GY698_08230 [Actinomycetia bacterium]|nr:hypothetical protein [Actinomycetes bacterium]
MAGFALGVTMAGLASRLPSPGAVEAIGPTSESGETEPQEGQRVTFELAGGPTDELMIDLTGPDAVIDFRVDPDPTILPPVSVTRPPTDAADAFRVDTFATTTTTTTRATTTTVLVADTPTTPTDTAAAALAQITYPWELLLPEWRIEFHEGRDGVLGYTWSTEQRIEIFVRDGQTVEFLSHVIAHELGHAVDIELNSPDDRRDWQASRGISGLAWWAESGMSDFATGAGDWAESFAAWQVGDRHFRSQLAGVPSAEQVTLMAELAAN